MMALAGCVALPSGAPDASQAPDRSGTVAGGTRLALHAGVGNVRVRVVLSADSVQWTVRSEPAGCVTVATTSDVLLATPHGRRCRGDWDVTMPETADLDVQTSVGDIAIDSPGGRSARLVSGVGTVSLRIDGREVRHSASAGSGDEIELGDVSAAPRVRASSGVGRVSVALSSSAAFGQR